MAEKAAATWLGVHLEGDAGAHSWLDGLKAARTHERLNTNFC